MSSERAGESDFHRTDETTDLRRRASVQAHLRSPAGFVDNREAAEMLRKVDLEDQERARIAIQNSIKPIPRMQRIINAILDMLEKKRV